MLIIAKKKNIGVFFSTILFLGLSLGFYSFALHPNMKNWIKEGIVVSQVNTQQKAVALTFDDGPDPNYTPLVLNALKKHGAHATFFLMGKRAQDYPELLKRMSLEGHEIGNHSFSHPDFNNKSKEFILEEIKKTSEIIEKTTGIEPGLFRPPGGYLSYDLVKLCKKENLIIAYWTYQQDSKDWQNGMSADRIADHIIKHIEPGQIIILHDGCPNGHQTAKATDMLLSKLKEKGYKFLTVSELIKLEEKE